MYINITDKKEAQNKGGSGKLVHYLEKENRTDNGQQPEQWFNGQRSDIDAYVVRRSLDGNNAKLGRNEAKFFLINISPSQKELAHLKKQYGESGMKEQLKQYAEKVMDEYARNFKRNGIDGNRDLLWFAKLENHRYFSHNDNEVKQGLKKRGEKKTGDQMHIQVIVSRKDITGKVKLSPMNSSKGRNAEHSKKMGQFDRTAFKQCGETIFDRQFRFERNLKESMEYANTMKNGTLEERLRLLSRVKELEISEDLSMTNQPHHSLQAKANEAFEQVTDIAQEITKATFDILGGLFDPGNISGGGENTLSDEERKRRRKKKGRGR